VAPLCASLVAMRAAIIALLVAPAAGQAALAQCDQQTLVSIIRTMTTSCQTLLGNALASGTSLSNEVQCPCFLEVPSTTVAPLACTALATDRQTIYQTYQQCMMSPPSPAPTLPPVCPAAGLMQIIANMSTSCQLTLQTALTTGTQLQDWERCPCYLEAPEWVARGLNCRALQVDGRTIHEDWTFCATNYRKSWKWLWSWTYSWGFKWLGGSWGFGWGAPGFGWLWARR